ncbi:hypothetical protein L7F22_021375 [Adiantum nelumboides]|nr:hypothetical protein [Adiantum nelumboides]
MTVISEIKLLNGRLLVRGKAILTNVPKNVLLTPSSCTTTQGVFLGALFSQANNRHIFKLGVLRSLRFMCCFRFNLWWMTHRMGMFGKEIPMETQFLLVESNDNQELQAKTDRCEENSTQYVVFLPLVEGPFRASLQGSEEDEVELCLESGDANVATTCARHSLFVYAGGDPFQVVADAVQAVESHLQTFRRREDKKMPGILNSFGWCTWDAFYTDVSPEGVKQGLKSLEEGGVPAKFVIIDDGWQSVDSDAKAETQKDITSETQFSRRLTDIKENHKFRPDERVSDLKLLIKSIKAKHSVKYVYVWHALAGYWGGVRTYGTQTAHYDSSVRYPKSSPGIQNHQVDMALDKLSSNGVALVHPKKVLQFYNDLHSYLAEAGVDGVKVDVQNILETVGTGFGGRVSLTQQYHEALEASVSSHFPDNGCIACMCHNTDGLYSIKQTAIVRASDDFWPRDPASHTIHITAVAYNSIFLGEFMQPDWDMFQSLHPAAEYHAAARAIGGCPVYVSDKPGQHDFKLLKKLVLPDGSILRAKLPGRPTRDSLFADPARDGKSLLKIWNLNTYTGVLGTFNCQGAGWCKQEKIYVIHTASPATITGSVCSQDVEWLHKIAPEGWDGACVLFSHREGMLHCLSKSDAIPITLKVLEYEVFTVSPIKRLGSGVSFAPIGLLSMFNSGGATVSIGYRLDTESECCDGSDIGPSNNVHSLSDGVVAASVSAKIYLRVHGCGECGMYSSVRPRDCRVNSQKAAFTYNSHNGLVSFMLQPQDKNLTQEVEIVV